MNLERKNILVEIFFKIIITFLILTKSVAIQIYKKKTTNMDCWMQEVVCDIYIFYFISSFRKKNKFCFVLLLLYEVGDLDFFMKSLNFVYLVERFIRNFYIKIRMDVI